MDWKEEPATQQQLLRLQEYGFVPTCQLTVTQAARLIRQYKHPHPARAAPVEQTNPQALVAKEPAPVLTRTAPARAERAVSTPTPMVSDRAKIYAYQLRLAVEAAERALSENPDRPGGRADVHSAIAARQRFWLDTCRDGFDLEAACPQAIEFHDHIGLRYFPPSWDEVAEVLAALDCGLPGWDKEHPELFYETLKLNYPSLLRHK